MSEPCFQLSRRQIREEERLILREALFCLDDEEKARMLDIVDSIESVSEFAFGAVLRFNIVNDSCASYNGQHQIGSDVELIDLDGSSITVIVYANELGIPFEMEFIKWGDDEEIRPDFELFKAGYSLNRSK
jgi:hypothetical protein